MDKQRRRELKKLGAEQVRQDSAAVRAALEKRNPFPVGDPNWVENVRTEYRLNREFRSNSTEVLRDQDIRKHAEIRKLDIEYLPEQRMHPRPGWYLRCGRCLDLVPTNCSVPLKCSCGAVGVDPLERSFEIPQGEYSVVTLQGIGELRGEQASGPWWKFPRKPGADSGSGAAPASLLARVRQWFNTRPAGEAPAPPLSPSPKVAGPEAARMTFPYPFEVIGGATAVERLHALRAEARGIPVILGGKEQFERVEECYGFLDSTPEGLLAKAAALDPLAWLAEREEEDSEYFEIEAAGWPEQAEGSDELSAHLNLRMHKPLDEVYIAVLPARHAWEAACFLKIGGWNAVPHAHEHSALWRYWEERYGARVACIADDVIEFTVERPPQTREEAMVLARQHFIYCADIVHQGVGSVEALAATLLDAPVWYFWWD